MRILFTAPRFHTNQVPVVKGLKAAGHDVCYFVAFTGATEDHSDCVPTVLRPSRTTLREARTLSRKKAEGEAETAFGGHFIPDLPSLQRAFETYMPDLVICRGRTNLTLCVNALCARHRIPCLLYDQEPVLCPSGGPAGRPAGKERTVRERIGIRLDRALNPERRALCLLRETTGFPAVRLSPVRYRLPGPAGMPGDRAYYVPLVYDAPEEARDREYMAGGRVNLLFVGKYREYKNIPVLLSALEELKDDGRWRLVMAGQAVSGEEKRIRGEARERIARAGLEERITLLENIPYACMPELYRAGDVLILPSRNERHGMAIVEAMAHGMAVICSDTCGAAFCNAEAGGVTVPEGDSHALACAVRGFLGDPDRLKETGRSAFRYVRGNLSFDAYRDSLNGLLRKELRSDLRI